MKNRFLTFILIVLILGIIGGIAYAFIQYVVRVMNIHRRKSFLWLLQSNTAETLTSIEPTMFWGSETVE